MFDNQITESGPDNVAQSGLAPAALLSGCEPDPGRHLTTALKVMPVADASKERTGGDEAEAGALPSGVYCARFRAACTM